MALLCKLCTLLTISVLTLIILTGLGVFNCFLLPKLPEIKDQYWGEGAAKPDKTDIKPFKIAVPDKDLQDLKQRLKAFRFIQPVEDAKFLYGFNGDFTKKLVKHWSDKYNWREWETRLNSFSHFKTQIQGLDIHFIRAKADPSAKVILPLLLVHGWPGSVLEFYKVIPQLTKPVDGVAFEVIAPSIPGYGWSEGPHKSGMGVLHAGNLFFKLMERLGFKDNFYMHGGDWGALIGAAMSRLGEKRMRGFHTSMLTAPMGDPRCSMRVLLGTLCPCLVLNAKEAAKMFPVSGIFKMVMREMGYMHIQATRPDTVGHALSDSPVGLAAYILEKFSVWTSMEFLNKTDGGFQENKISLDEALTNVMIYWASNSITSSMRLYKEELHNTEATDIASIPTSVPTGVSAFKNELMRVPEPWAHYAHANLLQYSDYEDGGHFPGLEVPDVLAKDIREFVMKAESFWKAKGSGKKEKEL